MHIVDVDVEKSPYDYILVVKTPTGYCFVADDNITSIELSDVIARALRFTCRSDVDAAYRRTTTWFSSDLVRKAIYYKSGDVLCLL